MRKTRTAAHSDRRVAEALTGASRRRRRVLRRREARVEMPSAHHAGERERQ